MASLADASAAATSADPVKSVYLVSAEGGGIRASYWTAVGLGLLDAQTGGDISENVAILSGVSGGSLGIAAWVAAKEASNDPQRRIQLLQRFLGSDFLSPLVGGALFLDIPRLIFGRLWFSPTRDEVFEKALADQWMEVGGTDFFYRPLLRPCLKGFRVTPTLFFNATDMERGNYAPLTTTLFDGWPQDGSPFGPQDGSAFGSFRFQDTSLSSIPIVQAVSISARFPFVSSAAYVGVDLNDLQKAPDKDLLNNADALADAEDRSDGQQGKRLRIGSLVDGGYYDNTGLVPISRALSAVQDFRRTTEVGLPARRTRFISIHFSNDASTACVGLPKGWREHYSPSTVVLLDAMGAPAQCTAQAEMFESAGKAIWLQWMTTPLQAILNVREGHSRRQRIEFERVPIDSEPKIDLSYEYEVTEGYGAAAHPPFSPLFGRPDPYKLISENSSDVMALIETITANLVKRGLLKPEDAPRLVAEWRRWDGTVRTQARQVSCDADAAETNVPLGWALSSQNVRVLGCLASRAVIRTGLTVAPPPRSLGQYAVPELGSMLLANSITASPKVRLPQSAK